MEHSVLRPSINISLPWGSFSVQNPGNGGPFSNRRQRTKEVLLVAREIGGKAILTSLSQLIAVLTDLLKIFLEAVA